MTRKAVSGITTNLEGNRSVTGQLLDDGGYRFMFINRGKITDISMSAEAARAMVSAWTRLSIQDEVND